MQIPIDMFLEPDICTPCGGKCCKHYAGGTYPNQWGINEHEIYCNVLIALRSRKYAIDYWEGDVSIDDPLSQVYYVRPAHTNAIGDIVDSSWGGRCVMLTEIGCSLSTDKRPMECLGLKPATNGNCTSVHSNKAEVCRQWLGFQHILVQIIGELNNE